MRLIEIHGMTVRLNERDWKTLERRFNLESVEESGETLAILQPCICHPYPNCEGCPFHRGVGGSAIGCSTVLTWILDERTVLSLGFSYVKWWREDDSLAREQIGKVHSFLLSMKKVRR